MKFILPSKWDDGKPDNLIPHGERLNLGSDGGFIREMHILYAGDLIDGK
jgi:hypothetical protein